jgi:hypothetical protein
MFVVVISELMLASLELAIVHRSEHLTVQTQFQ